MSRLLGAFVMVVLSFLIYIVPGYWKELIGISLAFGLFAASVDFAWGYGGVLNLGSALYFGLGSYFVAYSLRAGWGFFVGVLLGSGASLLINLIVASAALRRRTSFVQFGLIGLVLSLTAQQAAVEWYSVTGGSNGISGVELPSSLFSVYVAVGSGIGLMFLGYLVDSFFGKILVCVRDEPLRAEASGYSPFAVRLWAISITSVLASLSGSLYIPLSGIAHPGLLGVVPNMLVLVWVAIGGQGSLWGPFLCAAILKIVEFELGSQFENVYLLVLGLGFVGTVLFWPNGIAGSFLWRHHEHATK